MRGATILKASDDKTKQLNKHTMMAFSGEAGDTGNAVASQAHRPILANRQWIVQFSEYIQANIQLYSMRNDTDLGPSAVASFVRGELARSLRSRKPYTVNLLLGGMDPITKRPHLYWLDYLASLAPLPYAAHGYAQYVVSVSLRSLSGQITVTKNISLTGYLDTIAYLYLTNTITLTSTLSRDSRF